MKIARPMVGIEGLLTAPVSLHAEGSAPKVSFAESLRETLTATVKPQVTGQPAESDEVPLNVETTDKQAEGNGTKVQARLSDLVTVSNSFNGAMAAKGSVTTTGAGGNSFPSTDVISPPETQENLFPGTAAANPSVLPLGQQESQTNEATELLLGRGGEGGTAVKRLPSELPDLPRADGKGASESKKVSCTTPAKGKESEAVAHHKQKHVSGDVVTPDQPSQQDQRMETAGMVQPTVAPDAQVANRIACQMLPQDSSLPSLKMKETAPQDSKPISMHALRQRQTNQLAAPAESSRGGAGDSVGDKMAHPRYRDAKTAVDTTAKPVAPEHGSASKENGSSAVTQIVLRSDIASSAAPVQAHMRAIVPAGAIADARQAPADGMPQTTAVSSHSTYAPVDHGTIMATPTALEVGLPGGSHGWVKVRAELGGDGTVHASMSSTSAAGTEVLRRELPQLTSYLHQEQIHLSSVVVHPPHAPAELSNQASSDSRGQATNGGSSDAHRGHAGREHSGSSHSQERTLQTASLMDGEGDLLVPGGFEVAGGWLSVRA